MNASSLAHLWISPSSFHVAKAFSKRFLFLALAICGGYLSMMLSDSFIEMKSGFGGLPSILSSTSKAAASMPLYSSCTLP